MDALNKVLAELLGEGAAQKKGHGRSSSSSDDQQFDILLPPEVPTNWVQCDTCHKWRRVAWHVDSEALDEKWVCAMNTWDPDSADCNVDMDAFDAERESTLVYNATGEGTNEDDYAVGTKKDVFCKKNRIYYVAEVWVSSLVACRGCAFLHRTYTSRSPGCCPLLPSLSLPFVSHPRR